MSHGSAVPMRQFFNQILNGQVRPVQPLQTLVAVSYSGKIILQYPSKLGAGTGQGPCYSANPHIWDLTPARSELLPADGLEVHCTIRVLRIDVPYQVKDYFPQLRQGRSLNNERHKCTLMLFVRTSAVSFYIPTTSTTASTELTRF